MMCLSQRFASGISAVIWLITASCTPIARPNSGASTHDAADSIAMAGRRAEQAGEAAPPSSPPAPAASVKVGDTCNDDGARACAANASRIPLACQESSWMLQEPCDQGERCESGMCVAIAPECMSRQAGREFCDGDDVRTCRDNMPVLVRGCGKSRRCALIDDEVNCVCVFGSVDRGQGCEVPTDCETDNGGCDPLTKCSVESSGRVCGDCPSGFNGDGVMGCHPLLSDLKTANASLTPAFSPDRHDYRVQLPLLQQRLTLTPSLPAGVEVEINGSKLGAAGSWTSPVLPLGEHMFELVVTSTAGVPSTYTIMVEHTGVEEAYVKPHRPDAQDRFGYGIALSGDTLIVGSVYEDSKASGVNGDDSDDSVMDSGAAYVFVRKGKTWAQEAYLKPDVTSANDFFGLNVAVSGDTAAVTSTRSSPYSVISSARPGAVFVFARSGGAWTQQAKLVPDTSSPDLFGFGVALQGDRLVVGAPYDNDGARMSGALYVFERTGTKWSAGTKLKAHPPVAEAMLGWSVAMDGDSIIGGAPQDNQAVASVGPSGAAHVFVLRDGAWSEQQKLVSSRPNDGDIFGWKVAISGDVAAVGAPQTPLQLRPMTGLVDVFARTGDKWNLEAALEAPVPRGGDSFGSAVGLSGTNLAIGACNDASGSRGLPGDPARSDAQQSGAAYVYGRQDGTWVRSAYIKSSNSDEDDCFGDVLSLDGESLAVTAAYESSASSGVGGDESSNSAAASGAAYVFR